MNVKVELKDCAIRFKGLSLFGFVLTHKCFLKDIKVSVGTLEVNLPKDKEYKIIEK